MASSRRKVEISSVARVDNEGLLEVEFNGSFTFSVPYSFIRDSCQTCFDARTGLRIFSVSSVPEGFRAEDAGIVRGNGYSRLRVEWDDGQATELDAGWLYQKCVSEQSDSGFGENTVPSFRIWGSELSKSLPTFDYKQLCADPYLQYNLLQSLIYKEGAVLIQAAPARSSSLKQVCNKLLRGETGLKLNLASVDGGATSGG
eukprot:CAMPEP_0181300038 /NCGR_PEP_ID=MMETSP1101-20121128/6671_1 /TAXON_ID=46948 /ORGANISM="Rhodomonas abbreviata, Strain Caron Lab Isolate" /LENGTH=200 /DNA_ID=CAMNT_0023405237 /DNA_START=291 /DNA_END=889 /DNA_ORIENTATION=+